MTSLLLAKCPQTRERREKGGRPFPVLDRRLFPLRPTTLGRELIENWCAGCKDREAQSQVKWHRYVPVLSTVASTRVHSRFNRTRTRTLITALISTLLDWEVSAG